MDRSDNNNIRLYGIQKIADWQLRDLSRSNLEDKISLPDIQRSFVWGPHQIEMLWDSLLRGFPISSMLLSEVKSALETKEFNLLDGQQRSTAISIGLQDPWKEISDGASNFWKLDNIPILWIDLHKPPENDSRNFIFRLITKSHPWGYDRTDIQIKLRSEDRNKALDLFLENMKFKDEPFSKPYYEMDLKIAWPYDAHMPIPFIFLWKIADQVSDIQTRRIHLLEMCKTQLPRQIKTKHTENYFKRLRDEYLKEEFLAHIFERIDVLKKIQFPALVLDRNVFKETETDPKDAGDSFFEDPNELEEENDDALEALFFRINALGTPLAGEELIYSIYKSEFPDAIHFVESCKFIAPSRLLSFVVRMTQAEIMRKKRNKKILLPSRVKVKDFRRHIHNEEFKRTLRKIVDSISDGDSFLTKAQKILHGALPWQLSMAQVFELGHHAPEALFVLLYRLYRGDDIENGSDFHKLVLGFITSISWFGKGEGAKNMDPLLKTIWGNLLGFEAKEFWSHKTLEKALFSERKKTILTPLPAPTHLKKFLSDRYLVERRDLRNDDFQPPSPQSSLSKFFSNYSKKNSNQEDSEEAAATGGELCEEFVFRLLWNTPLLMYAMRDQIKWWFDDFYKHSLEDSDSPCDKDHILPQDAIRKRRNIDNRIRNWVPTIGNIRYWPVELNRRDSNAMPSTKLEIHDDNERIVFEKYNIHNQEKILECCLVSEEWKEIDETLDFTSRKDADFVVKLIIERTVLVYEVWYSNLSIRKLFPG